jgi:peptide subunit release factor 1 (eRF1)
MVTREAIRELARYQFHDGEEWALSFYFQPRTPASKSHHEDTIVAKELLRNALKELPPVGHSGNGRKAALNRLLDLAGGLQAGRMRAKAVFAAGANFWREYDLPPQLPATQLFLERRFHLKPLAMLLGAQPRLGVVLVDRQKARLFDLRLDELTERLDLFQRLPRRRSDGYAGYDAGHAERHVEDHVLHHLKNVAERLKEQAEQGLWEKLIAGCHEKYWAEFEPHLHSYVRQRLLGHFGCDVGTATNEEVRRQALRIFDESLEQRRQQLVRAAIDQAKGQGLGAIGLRQVLRALETGEVQTLLMGENYSARAVQCTNCGRIDSHLVGYCALCGSGTRGLEDVSEAIIAVAVERDIEVLFVRNNADLDRVGNIAALLRYRIREGQTGAVA